ncbi:MAG: hypothetical protein EOR30_28730 [Mesorhizobium sp.]|uniref:hypothetical protein n=1 Tax=unclassified Mesorhizobium TaxID=325217 RepID=UPI000FCA35BC|nr:MULTISPECIES: hypothetical protein [unclassified Mesorhizobium]RUV69744.1 hypothetical protein EOA78_22630 [Mesorhizobium sp. M5C.F.Cr.IN.023.01.1.1]RWF87570.1 MAG: hypothetical protein EOQ36_12100 [Mesorhizobium sp.]RWF92208.1 MAG: hypothetical protein EOQ45_22220 [Mesorhizobium sp.]RWI42304.1 MAG: hypothetical protein EOR14_03905 [Mesorhizobium sp.]RWI48746.1 MAG: hypothetical protein EOR16_32730 [Mesorhizobium sp.]
MRHLSGSESQPYVSDRLAAVSNVPTQFLVSAGMAATILAAASVADFMPKRGEAVGFVDAQKTASVVRVTEQNAATPGSCHRITDLNLTLRAVTADERK